MGSTNHTTKRKKKFFRRNRLGIAAFVVLLIGVVCGGLQYSDFVSRTVYKESVSHLTEVFHQSNNLLSELADKNLTYLHMWSEYLTNTSDESEIREYIDKAQEEAGFLSFYFLSADGNYKMATGETGYLGLQENLEDEIRQGKDLITNVALPGKSQMLVFVSPRAYGTYQGFEYDAIAIAYENADIVKVLDISAFQGNAKSYVVHSDGRVVIDHSNESWGTVYNFFGVLREHSDISEEIILELSDQFKEGRTDAMLVKLDGKDYYLVYEKSKIQDWTLLGLVPTDIVNTSMNTLQFTTMLLVGAVMLCVTLFIIGLILKKSSVSLKKKDTEILYRDELFKKLSMNVEDVFLMLDARTYKADYISPNVNKLFVAVDDGHVRRNIDAAVFVGSGQGKLVVVLVDGAADSAEAVVAVRHNVGQRELRHAGRAGRLDDADIGDVVAGHRVELHAQVLHGVTGIMGLQNAVGDGAFFGVCLGDARRGGSLRHAVYKVYAGVVQLHGKTSVFANPI